MEQLDKEEDWVAFDTRDVSKHVTVRAKSWKEACDLGRRELKIRGAFVNAGKRPEGMIDHDFAPKTTVRKKS